MVYERPVLVVPPPIGRFYFLDLAPGRSFVQYAVSRSLQTLHDVLAVPRILD
jgi:polyhydroxyalkanoate synthase